MKKIIEAIRRHIMRQRKLTPTTTGFVGWSNPTSGELARASKKKARKWQIRPDKT